MGIHVRALIESDLPWLGAALRECGAFSDEEIAVAETMLRDALSGDYECVVASADRPCGYALFGRTPFTESTWHLYWICVAPAHQRTGAGASLLRAMEDAVRCARGLRIIVETSGRSAYLPARALYERAGYMTRARIVDYYKRGDDLLLLEKPL